MIATGLLIAALVLFILGAWSVPTWRVNLISAGLACWVLSILLGKVMP